MLPWGVSDHELPYAHNLFSRSFGKKVAFILAVALIAVVPMV